MTDKIGDLLTKRSYDEPPEVKVIKDFIRNKFAADAAVSVNAQTITIAVQGAALAGALRMQLHSLQKLCGNNRRLRIRIV